MIIILSVSEYLNKCGIQFVKANNNPNLFHSIPLLLIISINSLYIFTIY